MEMYNQDNQGRSEDFPKGGGGGGGGGHYVKPRCNDNVFKTVG